MRIQNMDISSVDLNLLKVFDALIQKQQVTAAGASIGLSQPAMSFALSKLRKSLGDPLFVRTSRGLRPTPRALQLAAPVRQTLDLISTKILSQSAFDAASTRRTFVLSLSDVGELLILPRVLKRLDAEAPNASLKAVSLRPVELQEALASGDVDLAVGYFPDLAKADFYQQRLYSSHVFVCIMRAGHPRIGATLSLDQFLSASHAVVHPEGRSDEVVERFLERKKLQRRVRLSIPHFMSVPFIVAESDLIVTVPYAVGQSFSKLANIKILPAPFKVPVADIKQHWHVRLHHDPVNQWLRKIMAELFGEWPSK